MMIRKNSKLQKEILANAVNITGYKDNSNSDIFTTQGIKELFNEVSLNTLVECAANYGIMESKFRGEGFYVVSIGGYNNEKIIFESQPTEYLIAKLEAVEISKSCKHSEKRKSTRI